MPSTNSSYDKTVKKKLSFKGVKKPKKKKRSNEEISDSSAAPAQSSSADANQSEGDEIVIETGTGRVSSSGNTVQGHDTKFVEELSPGDAIIVFHPQSLRDETKIVRMVLSDISIGISSAFSSDLISTAQFRYIKAPKEEMSEEAKNEAHEKALKKRNEMERDAFGTYASSGGENFVYRVRNKTAYGGYKIVTEKVKKGEDTSRESFLLKRTKHKADRHC